jgi:hypothetical protein
MVDGDDFTGVVDTYPAHPISKNQPEIRTQAGLIQHRKEVEKQDIGRKKGEMDAKVAHLQKI